MQCVIESNLVLVGVELSKWRCNT